MSGFILFIAVFLILLGILAGHTWAVERENKKKQVRIDAIKSQLHKIKFYLNELEETVEYDWDKLISVHKLLAKDDVLPKNCDVDEYGMIRAESIDQISKDNIYLGNIYGLWTFPIRTWETCTDEQSKHLVWRQYYTLLYSNLQALHGKMFNEELSLRAA